MTNAANTRTNDQMCERLKKKYTPRTKAAFDSSKDNSFLKKARESFDPFEMYDEIGEAMKSELAETRAAKSRPQVVRNTAAIAKPIAKRTTERKKQGVIASFLNSRTSDTAIKVKAPSVPLGFILSLIILGTLLMIIIFSYSRISGFQSEISDLKSERSKLSADLASVAIEIEKRDDIRVIESFATDHIGMVKGDTIEKRFITISGGEKIEVIENTDEGDELQGGFFSNLLSALTSGFSRLSEYFN